MSELSAAAEVPVATIKYYLRERLLPEGMRTSATQAAYSDAHVQRLLVIRALLSAGVSIADTRRVVEALDAPPPGPYDLLGVAHAAVTPHVAEPADPHDVATATALYERLGGELRHHEPSLVDALAHALATLRRAGFTVPPAVLDSYVESARRIAEAEIDGIPAESVDAAVRYVVLGTVLTEPLLLALRRAAQQIVSGERFGDA
ncbi:MerR family transcriptional regulator [Microbacterium sp. NPDC091313]